jgi:hypothetical protein
LVEASVTERPPRNRFQTTIARGVCCKLFKIRNLRFQTNFIVLSRPITTRKRENATVGGVHPNQNKAIGGEKHIFRRSYERAT